MSRSNRTPLYGVLVLRSRGEADVFDLAGAVFVAPPLIIVGVTGLPASLLPVVPWRRGVLITLLTLAPVRPSVSFFVYHAI